MAGITTPIVTTSTKDAIFCAGETQDVTGNNGKPALSVEAPIVAKLPKDGILGTDQSRDAMEHDMKKIRQVSSRLPSRRREKVPYLAQVSIGMTLDTMLYNKPSVTKRT
jgi:hypothetical protein